MNTDSKEALCCLQPPISGLPNYYKYRAIGDSDSKDFRNTKAMIMEGEIYLATYPELNDPYEYHYKISYEATLDEKKDYFIQRYERKNCPHDVACLNAEEIVRGDLRQWEQEGKKKFDDYLKNQHGIFCASTSYDNILMWSHYADKHTGVCVVFQFDNQNQQESIDFFSGFSEVLYDKTIPEVNIYKLPFNELAHAVVTTKAKLWKYEKEHRYVRYTQFPLKGCMRINPSLISGVIIGLCISEPNKEMILDWSKSRKPQFSVYQAVMNKHQYSLDIVPVRIP